MDSKHLILKLQYINTDNPIELISILGNILERMIELEEMIENKANKVEDGRDVVYGPYREE